jgi:aminoglycoside 6'-N-acetyltransferase I
MIRGYPIAMDDVVVRYAERKDIQHVAEMCHCLWPDASVEEHARDLMSLLNAKAPGALPTAVLLAHQPRGRPFGFVEVGLRSHADGCETTHPVGYIEGWYVAPEFRRQKIGSRLIAAAENWARSQGCVEMASDTWLDDLESQFAHGSLGFELVDRCVHYRKKL